MSDSAEVVTRLRCSFCHRDRDAILFSMAGPGRYPHRGGRSYVCRDCRRDYRRQERQLAAARDGRVYAPRPSAKGRRPGTFRCAACRNELPRDAFRWVDRRRRRRDGSMSEPRPERQSYCRPCMAQRTAENQAVMAPIRKRDPEWQARRRVQHARENARAAASRRLEQIRRTEWVCGQARQLWARAEAVGMSRMALARMLDVADDTLRTWLDHEWETAAIAAIRAREGYRPGNRAVRESGERKVTALLLRLADDPRLLPILPKGGVR